MSGQRAMGNVAPVARFAVIRERGPLGDGARGLLVVDAGSEELIRSRLATDPWSAMGLLTVTSIETWTVLLEHASRVAQTDG